MRRRGRRIASAAGGALLLAACLWLVVSHFRAPHVPVEGTPYVLRAQDGVPADQVAGVTEGLQAGASHLAEVVGVALHEPAEVRVSWSQGCEPPWIGPTSLSTAWARPGLMCLNAAHPRWADQADDHDWYPQYVAAHEQVHLWQAELGCFHEGDDHQWQWLFEGMADHLAFSALEQAGVVSEAEVLARIRELGGLEESLGPVSAYEVPTQRTGKAYPLFHLAARVTADAAASPGAWADFCRLEGAGTAWEDAFAQAFGFEVGDVDALVNAERRALR